MIRLRKADLVIGRPLSFPLFDRDRHLLLPANSVIESEAHLAEIAARGLFREGDAGASGAPEAGKGRPDPWKTWKFEDLKLPVGTRVSLQKLEPGDETRYTSHLVGVLKDASIITEVPAPGGELAMFRQGQPLLLRIFNGTRVFAFMANVLFVRYSPKAYLHLQWPKGVEGTEVRARQRVKVRLIAAASAVMPNDIARSHAVVTEDLSAGGARIVSMVPLGDVGGDVDLSFRLRTAIGEGTLKLHGRIRTEGPARAGSKERAYGVEFIDLEPLELLTLEGFVHTMNEDGPPQ